jgi:transcriptional regulator with XRE-family HTH domain
MNTPLIGHQLKAKRKELKLSQKEVAGRVFVSRPHLANLESGKRPFRLDTFILLCKLLSIDLNQLSI